MRSTWRLLWPHLALHRGPLALAILAMVGEIGTALAQPVPVQRVVDLLVQVFRRDRRLSVTPHLSSSDTQTLLILAGAVVVIALLDALFTYLDLRITTRVSQLATVSLRRSVYTHIQRLGLSFHHASDTRTGDLQLRLGTDVLALQDLAGTTLSALVTNLGTAVLMLALLLLVQWRVGLIVLAGSLPVYVLSRYYRVRVRQAVREARRQEGQVSAMLSETLAAAKLVQVLGRENYESERLRGATDLGLVHGLRAGEMQARVQPLTALATSMITALVLLVAALLVLERSLTVGQLTLVLAYTRGTFGSLRALAKLPISTQRAAVGAERLSEILDKAPLVADPARPRPLPGRPLDISFDRVIFGYTDGRPVLHEFSWHIGAGATVALIGPTGAGKSTALALVPRLYDPWSGTVRLGSVDVRDLALAELRQAVTIVIQESLLFRDTIWNNVAYGRPEAPSAAVLAACEAAGVTAFVDSLEDGFETIVSERGTTLSGGQKQCVAIARALLRDAPVVIMDEPTSSLDVATENLVLAGIRRLIKGRTAIVIAHRYSTIRHADLVAVMEEGRLVEVGTPAAILVKDNLLSRVSRIQGSSAADG